MSNHEGLTAAELVMLKRVSHGEFRNVVDVPASVRSLVTRGYVQFSLSIAFPVLPVRYDYTLTAYGEKLLMHND